MQIKGWAMTLPKKKKGWAIKFLTVKFYGALLMLFSPLRNKFKLDFSFLKSLKFRVLHNNLKSLFLDNKHMFNYG